MLILDLRKTNCIEVFSAKTGNILEQSGGFIDTPVKREVLGEGGRELTYAFSYTHKNRLRFLFELSLI